jgi:hypothetical protein
MDSLKFVVYFWFPLDQQQRIMGWLNAFPKDFVFPAGSFSIIDPYVEAHIVSPADPDNWAKVYHRSKTKDWTYWQTMNIPPKAPIRAYIELRASDLRLSSLYNNDLHGMSPGFAPAVLSPSSPIRQEKSLVLISFRFDGPT